MGIIKSATIENRTARHEYSILETLECGVELLGNEVKSIRDGKASIKEAWITVTEGEMFIKQMHITPWRTSNQFDIVEKRDKKLLAHKQEIKKLFKEVKLAGLTLIPLKVYFSDKGKCKILIGLCKGKQLHDKRQAEKEQTAKREMGRELSNRR